MTTRQMTNEIRAELDKAELEVNDSEIAVAAHKQSMGITTGETYFDELAKRQARRARAYERVNELRRQVGEDV